MDSESSVPSDSAPGSHYFDANPNVESSPNMIELALPDVFLELETDSGVFSANKVDRGTKYLLREMPAIPSDARSILDLGCGYGPIALTLAKRAPTSTVWAVDVNERARDLTTRNASTNALPNVTVVEPDVVPPGKSFDLIVSNPPVRIGKPQLHELLRTWLARLTDSGRAWLVVQKHLGSDSLAAWLGDNGFPTTRLGSRKGYRVLEVVRSPELHVP